MSNSRNLFFKYFRIFIFIYLPHEVGFISSMMDMQIPSLFSLVVSGGIKWHKVELRFTVLSLGKIYLFKRFTLKTTSIFLNQISGILKVFIEHSLKL